MGERGNEMHTAFFIRLVDCKAISDLPVVDFDLSRRFFSETMVSRGAQNY